VYNMSHNKLNRIVVLIDMDCFYVQVEQRRNTEKRGKPCAVVQYNQWKGGGYVYIISLYVVSHSYNSAIGYCGMYMDLNNH